MSSYAEKTRHRATAAAGGLLEPVSQVSATTSGVDTPLSLNNGRVTVQLFAALPTGLTAGDGSGTEYQFA